MKPNQVIAPSYTTLALQVVEVPLSQLVPLSGLYDLSNRDPDRKKVDEILREWNPGACDPLKLYSLDGTLHIMCGHHRYEVFCFQSAAQGISREDFMARVEIHTEREARAVGMSPAAYIADVVRRNNFQNPEGTADHLQMYQATSPWVAGFQNAGLSPRYKGTARTQLNYSAILRAYITANRMLAADAMGESASDIIRMPLTATRKELEEAFLRPDPEVFNLALAALVEWETTVAGPLHDSPAKTNVRLAWHLLFVLLVSLNPDHIEVESVPRDLSARFTRPTRPYMPYFPARGQKRSHSDVVSYMLDHLNHKRTDKYKTRLFGRKSF